MAVSSLGAGSGLPLNQLLADLVAAEAMPLTALRNKTASVQSQVSAFGQVKSALSELQKAITALDDTKFTSLKAASSDAAVATVSASSKAKPFSGKLEVTSLATATKVVSAPLTATDGKAATPTAAIGSGKLVFTMGTAKEEPDSFVPSADSKDTFTVTISPDNNTLEGIRDAVNNAKGPVTATIMNDAGGARLVFSSSATGAASNFKVDAINDAATPNGLDQLSFDPANRGAGSTMRTSLGADAAFKLDGIELTSTSNTVSSTIEGLSFTLLKAGVTNLSTSKDNSAPKTALNAVVTAYNALLDRVTTYTKATPLAAGAEASERNDAPLVGDPTIRNMMSKIRDEIFTPLANTDGPYNSLTTLGLTFAKDGKLSLNDTVFEKAMTEEPDAVRRLFTPTAFGSATQSLSQRVASSIDTLTNDTDGLIKGRVDGLGLTTKTLQTQQQQLERRVAAVEARYRAQFVALDVALSSMNETRNYLAQQLSALNNLR